MKSIFKNLLVSLSLLSFIIGCRNATHPTVAYPGPLPDSVPLKFMPGIVTSDKLDFNSAYSPDGKSFYFGRSENGRWVIYVTTFVANAWSTPVPAAFKDSRYSEADPVFAPDGSLYYISNRPRNKADTIKDYDIWQVKPLAGNQWSEPLNLSVVNSDSNEFYISFAANGNLYFSSSRQGGLGEEDIYVSHYENDRYAQPVNLGAEINSSGSDHDPLIERDERFLIFTSSERKDSYGEADLYAATRHENRWRSAVNLGQRFNTPTYEYCPYLSPDNQYFFYSSESDIKWVKAEYLFKDIDIAGR